MKEDQHYSSSSSRKKFKFNFAQGIQMQRKRLNIGRLTGRRNVALEALKQSVDIIHGVVEKREGVGWEEA
ncbi:hypothetical protein SLEP1_g27766 [Rubroshorea leprosula]|uniref:Uncharacterized protein n=1 Tax=Rubroshorea leprosula TaxID=152421 RepID=A0AAV5JXH3_9ROSI|nr:hypothetical protein SLEP1_g27766 [Rubroshorea leprosula]